MSTIKRGRVLRDTSGGEGLVFVDGQQYPFRLEGTWRSEFAPKLNQAVDAEFDDSGKLVALRAAGSASGGAGAGAGASEALDAAGAAAKKMAAEFQSKGLPVIQEWAQRVGYPTIIAFVLLVAAWFWMPVVSMNMGFLGNNGISFYDSLVFVNGTLGSRGIFGLLVWVSLFAVWLPQVWKDRRAGYGMMLPLALMLLIGIIAWVKASPDTPDVGPMGNDPQYAQMMKQMADQARAEMWKAISFGFGLYVAAAAAIFLAFRGWQTTRGAGELSAQAA